MSTDVIRFGTSNAESSNQGHFSSAALKLYLELTFPLMLVTFAAWGVVYHYIKTRGGMDVDWVGYMSQ